MLPQDKVIINFIDILSVFYKAKYKTSIQNKILKLTFHCYHSSMGNCLKPTNQVMDIPQEVKLTKLTRVPDQKGLSLIMKCWKETHNNLYNFNLLDQQLNIQIINIILKKVRVVKLNQEYQALLPKDPQFSKIMPPVMIDVNELRQKDANGQKKYSFIFNDFPKISKPFWIIVKSLPSAKYLLKQGDIFKMGKIKIRVKQIIHKSSQTQDISKEITKAQFKIYYCQGRQCRGQKFDSQIKCKICMQEGQNANPLISVCSCIGSAKYTHFKCLRQWFTTQLEPTKINMVTQISWKALQCELCKTKLPFSINLDNEVYFLVEFPKVKKPYIVLNPVYKSTNEKSKIYYLISFKKRNRMIIGRKSDADIQLCTDATISRHHSVIQYVQPNPNEDGKFYLSDNSSKFGTVVLLHTKNPIQIDQRLNGVQFQVGGDVIKISYKPKNFYANLKTQQSQIDFNTDEQMIDDLRMKQLQSDEEEENNNEKNEDLIISEQNQNQRSSKQYNNIGTSSDNDLHNNSTNALMKQPNKIFVDNKLKDWK